MPILILTLVLSLTLPHESDHSHLKYPVVGGNPLFESNVDDPLTPDFFKMETKKCNTCEKEKTLDAFYLSSYASGRRYYKIKCIECSKKPVLSIPDLAGESWRDIKGYEGLYKISDKGRVKSLFRKMESANSYGFRWSFIPERILKTLISEQGYPACVLYSNHKKKRFHIHRLICLQFLENPENKTDVNHINGVKTDSYLENLEWCTPAENLEHARKTGLMGRPVPGAAHHLARKIRCLLTQELYGSIDEAAQSTGLNYNTFYKRLNSAVSNNINTTYSYEL